MEPTRADQASPDQKVDASAGDGKAQEPALDPTWDRTGKGRPVEETPIEDLRLTERPIWDGGPPLEMFKQMRGQCPIHWTDKITEYPNEAGYWSVTRADDVHTVSHDWKTYSSERGGVLGLTDSVMPLELATAMFIAMDPPKHDRLKQLFQRGFTPKRIAEHEDRIREIAVGVLDGLKGRETCDLVNDVAQPVVSRVIGSFMGLAARRRRDLGATHEHDAGGQRPRPQP